MSAEATATGATGARAIVDALDAAAVRIVFGLPGVHNLALWSALRDSSLRLVGVRHEQTAVYAADGQARRTGELGVAAVTTGPGAANALAATGEAYASHSPVLVIATDIPSTLRRPGVLRGVLHECRDQAAMFAPVVKRTFVAQRAGELAGLVAAAVRTALTAPAGPVYLQVPTDLLAAAIDAADVTDAADATADAADATADVAATGSRSPTVAHPVPSADADIETAAALLSTAERPLIWAGSGAVAADAGAAVGALALALGAPVLETYGARGLLGDAHPCAVGLPPHVPAAGALWDAADVVVAIGSDLDGMSTQNWAQPQPRTLIAINVDPADAAKSYRVDAMLAGDARDMTERLAAALGGAHSEHPRVGALAGDLARRRDQTRAQLADDSPDAIALLDTLEAVVPAAMPVVCDMCIPGYWVGALRRFAGPRLLAYPVGWGTLGFGFPASIGTALAGGGPVLAVCGDGGFMFACGELATVAQERPELTVLLVDDGGYGMLRYDQRHAGAEPFGVDLVTPDLVALARAFGVRATAVDDPGAPLARALSAELAAPGPGVVVLRARLDPPPTTSPRWYRRVAP